MAKSSVDAEINNQIFRYDNTAVLAIRRELAHFLPVRVKGDGADYLAGQVLARRTTTGVFERWGSVSGASPDSVCVLFKNMLANEFNPTVTGGALAVAIFGGMVYKSVLSGYDAGAKTAMAAKEQTDASGITIVKF